MLFKTTDKLSEYAELTDVNFFSVKSTINLVENEHILPALGPELYSSLNNAYTLITDEALLTSAQKYLLDKCRSVIGAMVTYYYAPKTEIKITDAGARRQETENSKTAFQYQVTKFREALLREAEMATESLLSFLDLNKSAYPEWVASTAFADYKNLFIKSGKEFNTLFASHSPYRNYVAMRSKMQDVEENIIKLEIGDTLFTALKIKDRSDTLTFSDKEKELVYKLKKSLAYYTVAFSIPFLNIRMDINGLTVAASNRTSDDEKSVRSGAADSALNSIITKCQDAGKQWLTNATKYLDDNVADFDGWPVVPVEVETDLRNTTTNCSPNEDAAGSFGMY